MISSQHGKFGPWEQTEYGLPTLEEHRLDNTNETNNTITPYGFYIYKDKTIVAPYAQFKDIPETRYYEEYTGGYWYRGTLK